MQLLARAARARALYRSTNAVVKKMMADLYAAVTQLVNEEGELSIRIRADAFVYDNEIVLEETNPDESIPFIFYRDGIRKLDLGEGLEPAELEVLVNAIAEGFTFSGLGDDIVSFLWRHELEHVRYMVVDTTIVDAAAAKQGGAEVDAFDLDEQIERLLRNIYGSSPTDDVGPRAVRVDGSELAAKEIVAELDELDDMAPGFHPARAIVDRPAYADQLRADAEKIGDDDLTRRAVGYGLRAIERGLGGVDADVVADTILKMYDAAIVGGTWYLASWILWRVRDLAAHAHTEAMAAKFVAEAVAEARLRQVTGALSTAESDDTVQAIVSMFAACGPTVVPTVLSLIPHIPDASRRQLLIELAARLGITELSPVRALLTNDQAFVAVEAVNLLSTLGTPEACELLASAQLHMQAPVRIAMLHRSGVLPQPQRMLAAVQLLDDTELDVRVAAARVLGEVRDLQAVRAIETRVKDPKFSHEPLAIKEAFLIAFVQLVQVRGLPLLAKMFQDGGGLLAKKDNEETAIAAARALAVLGTPGAVQALKKAGTFLNKRVRESATEALRSLRRAES
jgi:hypothetical protein